ncbi:MAG: class I SAM-dependent methyltransferase [Gammaproteobacteria bacterium]|nr:MAG: class I SAM-dependent methyltransferase [Gammaproteobacteria bacterium]
MLAGLGHPVDAVDREPVQPEAAPGQADIRWLEHDLEHAPWPFADGAYGGVVVTNYLHRPLFPHLVAALAKGGVLIYETYALGQERIGRPRNPAHLLMPGELLEMVRGQLRVVAYEDVQEAAPPRRVQRLCAVRP